MASGNNSLESLAGVIIEKLQLPDQILKILTDSGIELEQLININKDGLAQIIDPQEWNVDEVFARLARWRQEQGFQLLGFEAVELSSESVPPSSPPVSPAPSLASSIIVEDYLSDEASEIDPKVIPADTSTSNVKESTIEAEKPADSPTAKSNQEVKASDASVVQRQPLKEVWNAPGTSSAAVAAQSKYFTPQRLEALLNSTITGQDIIKRGASGPLSTDSQRELVQILTEYHCNAGKRAKEECLAEYAECIVALFKHEKAGTYYIPRAGGRKNPGGKLYNKIVNIRQKAAKRKLREEAHLTIKKPATSPETSDESAVKAVEWLKHNKLPWTTALDKWEQAYPLRKSLLGNKTFADELINRHLSVYQDTHGYQAIEADFRSMYGNIEDFADGIEKWNNAFSKLVQYLDRPYKDEFSKRILESLNAPDTNINTKNCSILLLLNNILKPTKITRNFKPSVLVAQEEVILFATSAESAANTFEKFTEGYVKYGFEPVPKLVFIGESVYNLSGEFQVRYKHLTYSFDTVVRAIDILVKCNAVFGLEYSRISRLVWIFISSFFYNIPVKEQYECINNLKEYLSS